MSLDNKDCRADNVDLDDASGAPRLKESPRSQQVRINEENTAPAVNIDPDLLRDLESGIMTMLAQTMEDRAANEDRRRFYNGLSRGLLCNCEIFAMVRLKL